VALERLRILHAIHDFLPRHRAGSEIYAFELGRALSARHHVHVLCADYDPSREHGHVTWRLHHGLPVIEVINNWVCPSFEDTYRSQVIGDRLAHLWHAVQPDVLHIHNLLNLTFDLPAIARAHGVPVVATLHDYALVCPSGGQRIHLAEQHVCETIDTTRCARCFRESRFHSQISAGKAVAAAPRLLRRGVTAVARRLPGIAQSAASAARRLNGVAVTPADIETRLEAARRVFESVDLFVAPSQSVAGEFVRLGIEPSKMHVSDYGFVPLNGDPPRTADGPLRIGYVGTPVWHKGVHVLIEAARRLGRNGYELIVFGDLDVFPDYSSRLRREAADLPVRFAGAFDRDRVADVYAQFDVLVVPSLWLENSPLVIHEAFMAGVPVVGARIGGIPGLVVDGVNGLLYEATSPDDLARVLRRLIEHPALVRELSGRVPAVKSIGQDAEEWEAIYTALVRRRAAAAQRTAGQAAAVSS